MLNEKNILVTGATGLIGSHIVHEILRESRTAHVYALGRNIKKLESCFSEYADDSRLELIQQDISYPLKLNKKVNYIFHAASPMEGKIIANCPVDVVMPNLAGTVNCLKLLREQEERLAVKGRLVLFSSVTVYGNVTHSELVVTEKDTQVANFLQEEKACYSESKRMSEVIALAYHRQYNLDIVIARFSTVYGDTFFRPDTAFFEFLEKSMQGENITLSSNGMPRRDNIFIDDAISGVMAIAEKGISGEAYNISSGGKKGNFAAVDEIAVLMAEIANKRYAREANGVKVSFKEKISKRNNSGIILDNSKLEQLGWRLKFSLEEGLLQTFIIAEKSGHKS